MNMFNNSMKGPDSACGSAAQRAMPAAASAKTGVADEAAANAWDDPVMGLQIFQLLLAKTSTSTDGTALPLNATDDTKVATASDASPGTNLSLFMALLPNLAPTATAAAASTAAGVSAVGDAAAPSPLISVVTTPATASVPASAVLNAASDNVNASVATATSGLSDLLLATALPALKKDASPLASLDADPKAVAADSFNRVLMSLDHAFQPHASAAVAANPAASGHDALADLPMTSPEWPTALGHRLMWTMGEGIQKAEIRVNPENMGPIHVHIQVKDDKTDIQFTALHPQAREALETSIPRLREMFAQQGLNLMQAQVFSQTPQNSGGRQSPNTDGQTAGTATGSAPNDPATVVERPQRRGWHLLDDYA